MNNFGLTFLLDLKANYEGDVNATILHSPSPWALRAQKLREFPDKSLLFADAFVRLQPVNMFMLPNFSTNACDRMGNEQFVKFYLRGALWRWWGGSATLHGSCRGHIGSVGGISAVQPPTPSCEWSSFLVPFSSTAEQCLIWMAIFDTLHIDKYFRNLIKSNWNQFVFTICRMI